MESVIYDAEKAVAGRLASHAAKDLLKGRNVFIVNAEKALVTGDRKYTESVFKGKTDRGDPYHGPFYPKTPDRILKRMVRGMLPYKKPMGAAAFKRLRVYSSVPEEFKDREFKTLTKHVIRSKSLSLHDISRRLK